MLNISDYKPDPLPREVADTICPHCGIVGKPTNRYLYRCMNSECGRYW